MVIMHLETESMGVLLARCRCWEIRNVGDRALGNFEGMRKGGGGMGEERR